MPRPWVPHCASKSDLVLDPDELSLEDERRVGRDDTAHGAVSVGKVGGDGELALLADLHAEEALIPALDDLALADSEVERRATVVAGVELGAISEGTTVVNGNGVSCGTRVKLASGSRQNSVSPRLSAMGEGGRLTALGLWARAFLSDLNLETVELGNRHSVGL